MPDYQTIYREHAAEYDALVEAEDVDHSLLPALSRAASLDGATIVEVGMGTGRLTRLIAPKAKRLIGLEKEPAMIEVARGHLSKLGLSFEPELHVGDARELPMESGVADVAIAGWVLGHFRSWFADDWKAQIGLAIDEMTRTLGPGGTCIIIETLGTGSTEPSPPNPNLAEYYQWLEGERGMRREAIRTDYEFADLETAAKVTGFFFGDAFKERLHREVESGAWPTREGRVRIPECTGVWSVRRAGALTA